MKKIILTGLTIITSFIGLSFATEYELNQPAALYNLGNDAIFTFTNGVNFNINSEYYNYMVAGGNNAKYNLFWNNTGLYFVYSYNRGSTDLIQGYIKKFCRTTYDNVCNGSTQATWINIDEFIGDSIYTNADYFNNYQSDTSSFAFCFGYENLNENICFLVAPYLSNEFSQFGNSLGITRNPNLADLPNDSIKNYFTTSPFSKQPTPTQPDTNDVCITVQQFFDIYGSTNNYNTGLCYTQDRYLTQTGRVQITPKFITELYPTYKEFRQDVNTRNNYCRPPATQQTCQQAFNGKEENRTLINKLQEGTDTAIIYDMCNIYQTRSGNMQKNFCDMTEEEAKIIGKNTMTTEKYAERIANNPTTTTTPRTGTVYDGLTDGTNRDILEAIPRVYTKITGIFKGRSGKDGIIPYYITGILLVIVLFKLFKK